MLLRRVIEHVKTQNWTAIGIDFVIVVLGVFLGIQVANWNTARNDERLGRTYAERLLADLHRESDARQRLVDYYAAVVASAEQTIALLDDPGADPQTLVVSAYRASESNYWQQTRTTWDEVVSSGRAGLLPRAAIEDGISDYFATDNAWYFFGVLQETPYRHLARTLISHPIQSAIRSRCGDVFNETGDVVGFQTGCDLGVDDAMLAEAATTLRSDPAMALEIRYQLSVLSITREVLCGDIVFLERAIAALEDEGFLPVVIANE